MFSARLPTELVDQLVEAAEEDGVSRADLVEPILAAAMDERRGTHGTAGGERMSDELADEAARAGVEAAAEFLQEHNVCPDQVLVFVRLCAGDTGAVAGLSPDPAAMFAEGMEFLTILAAAAGKQLTVEPAAKP